MLSRQKEQFSEVFYARYRQHVIRVLRRLAILLSVSGTASGILLVSIFRGNGDVLLTSVATAIWLWLVWVTYMSVFACCYARVHLPAATKWISAEGVSSELSRSPINSLSVHDSTV